MSDVDGDSGMGSFLHINNYQDLIKVQSLTAICLLCTDENEI